MKEEKEILYVNLSKRWQKQTTPLLYDNASRNRSWYWKPSWSPGASDVMDLRKESTTTTLLDQRNSLLCSKSYPYNHKKVQLPPFIIEVSLDSRWRPSQKTTTGYNAEINRSWVTQPWCVHQHHISLWEAAVINAGINMMEPMVISRDMLMWKGNMSWGLLPRHRQLIMAGRRVNLCQGQAYWLLI